MKLTLKNKTIEPMGILIDFFAFQYDLVYDSIKFLMKPIVRLSMEIKKISILDILIDFFASLYDLVYDFIKFLVDYIKWITDIRIEKTSYLIKQTEEPIQVHFRNHL